MPTLTTVSVPNFFFFDRPAMNSNLTIYKYIAVRYISQRRAALSKIVVQRSGYLYVFPLFMLCVRVIVVLFTLHCTDRITVIIIYRLGGVATICIALYNI